MYSIELVKDILFNMDYGFRLEFLYNIVVLIGTNVIHSIKQLLIPYPHTRAY